MEKRTCFRRFAFALLGSLWFCWTPFMAAVDLDVPMSIPRFQSFIASVPVLLGDPAVIDLQLANDAKGKIISSGASVVDGVPVEVKGSVKNKNGLVSYKLALKSSVVKINVEILGTFGDGTNFATINYKGPKGKSNVVQAVSLAAPAVQGTISFDPIIDAKGKLSGTGTIVSGFGNDPVTLATLKGSVKGDKLSWSLKAGKHSVSFKGVRLGDNCVGALKIGAPPEKGTLLNYSVADFTNPAGQEDPGDGGGGEGIDGFECMPGEDSDLDGVEDCIEVDKGTSPFDVDTDGDGLTDFEELGPLVFDPRQDPFKFNSRVADIPQIAFTLSSAPDITLKGVTSENQTVEFSSTQGWENKFSFTTGSSTTNTHSFEFWRPKPLASKPSCLVCFPRSSGRRRSRRKPLSPRRPPMKPR